VPEVWRKYDPSIVLKKGDKKLLCRIDRNRILAVAGGLVATLLVAPRAWPQMGPGMGYGPGLYDSSTEITVRGVVEEVQNSAYPGQWAGTHVSLKTDKGTYDVRLGPTPFLSQNNFSIAKGDTLSVAGSKLNIQETDFLIAREVTKDGKTLTLRNAQGFPAWAGRGMGRGAYTGAGPGWRGGCGCGWRCRRW
jgi:hypothetical protein